MLPKSTSITRRPPPLASNCWSTLSVVSALAAAVIDGKIHAVGGLSGFGRNTPAHEVYDPGVKKWTAAAPLPTARDGHVAVAAGQQLYVIGGRTNSRSGKELATNEAYDPASDKWEKRAAMPTARSGSAAAAVAGRVLVVGGEASSQALNRVEAYDPKGERWLDYAAMPTARHGLAAVEVDGKLYVRTDGHLFAFH